MDRKPDQPALVGDGPGDGLGDPPGRIGGETAAAGGIKLFHCLHEAEIPLLDQVGERDAAADIVPRDRDHETQIRVDHGLTGGRVAVGNAGRKREFLLRAEEGIAADLTEIGPKKIGVSAIRLDILFFLLCFDREKLFFPGLAVLLRAGTEDAGLLSAGKRGGRQVLFLIHVQSSLLVYA